MCVCVCVCVRERERERERDHDIKGAQLCKLKMWVCISDWSKSHCV